MKAESKLSGEYITIMCAFAAGLLLFPSPSSARLFGPLPPVTQPPNLVPLTPVEPFGMDILFDHTLSNPPGYAGFTCHVPETGFASTSVSVVHAILGMGDKAWEGHEPDEAHQALQPFIDPYEMANTAFTAEMGVGPWSRP